MTASHALSQLSYGPKGISDLRSTMRRIERMNLESLFQQFLKEKRFIQNVSQNTILFYEQSFKTFNLQDPVTKSQLKERVTSLREAGKSPACCDAYIRGINSFLTWLFQNEHLEEHLKVKRLKLERRVMKTFTDVQIKAILTFKPKNFYEARLHTLLCTLAETGIRIDEALGLSRDRIDFDNMLLTVKGKGNKERIVPFSIELRKALFKWLKQHKFNLVFPTRHGGRMLYDNVRRDFSLFTDKLGIDGFDGAFHAFRRCFAKNYTRKGGNLFYLQHILGHEDIKVTRSYVEVEIEALQETHLQTSLMSRFR
jgi:integrase/recombinase XerD